MRRAAREALHRDGGPPPHAGCEVRCVGDFCVKSAEREITDVMHVVADPAVLGGARAGAGVLLLASLGLPVRSRSPRMEAQPDPLCGTRWELELDIGMEKGSWMPPQWGASQARVTPMITVEFGDDGALRTSDAGYFDESTFGVRWEAAGGYKRSAQSTGDGASTMKWWLAHGGMAREDTTLDEGKLYFSAACWGSQLSNRGMLTIRQRKMGLMPFIPTPGSSSFIVGTFRARRVGDGDGDAPAAV